MNTKEAAVLLLARFSTSVKYAALFVIFAKLYSLTTSPQLAVIELQMGGQMWCQGVSSSSKEPLRRF